MPEEAIKVLLVDDNARDIELARIALASAGVSIESRSASDAPGLRLELAAFAPEIVLCDFTFPALDGIEAFGIVQAAYPGVPVIFVSGTISEELAAAALRCGAVDYVLKSNLTRLPSAVTRAAHEARERRALERSLAGAQEAVQRQAQRLETLWRIGNNASLRGAERIDAMLREAAGALRPPLRFDASVVRIEADALVVLSATWWPGDDVEFSRYPPGARIPIELSSALSAERTQFWAAGAGDLPPLARTFGWQSLIRTLFAAGTQRYVLTFGARAATTFDAADAAYIEVLADSFAAEIVRADLEGALREAQERLRRHADRLEALWRISNDPSLRGADRIDAMLVESASAIRPRQMFRGVISRLAGDEMVVCYLTPGSDTNSDGTVRYPIGTRLPRADTVAASAMRSRSWDDITLETGVPPTAIALGWRSVITTQFTTPSTSYVLTFGSNEPTLFTDDDENYVEVLAESFASQLALDDSERRTRLHAERLEALWRIVNNPNLRDEDMWIAMLRESALSIRPGQAFHGRFVRVEGDMLVREAVVSPPGFVPTPEEVTADSWERVPLANTVVARLMESGPTQSWDDIRRDAGETHGAAVRGWRAVIANLFTAGGNTYALVFAANEPAVEPFGAFEHAYVEVLGSFFARHVQERWQFERMAYQQSHDVLTGLLNRSQFRSLARQAAAGRPRFAIVLVDVNAFHEINETYGNMIGDALLVEVGATLRERAAGEEIVGRVAGDVFGVYLPDPATPEVVAQRARVFAETFARGFSTGDREGKEFIALTSSVGTAMAPYDGRTIDEILSHADAALFAAKERGPGSIVAYTRGMEGDPQRRATLRNDLIAAIAGDEFVLYYQPHVNVRDDAVMGCEALIRWQHPTRGLLPPGQFIPFAEQTGIITGIDEWVMRASFTAAAELSAQRPDFRLYFNLSGRQAGAPSVVHAFVAAARAGVPLQNLGVEITESDAMRDVEATRRVCRALRRLGVRVAIDDFGTGYSSLSSLKRLPVDIIKIDRTFISGILDDPQDETIAETIIAIAERFGFASLAEGVEREAEIEWLRTSDCRLAQGFAYSAALPMAEFKDWLAARRTS